MHPSGREDQPRAVDRPGPLDSVGSRWALQPRPWFDQVPWPRLRRTEWETSGLPRRAFAILWAASILACSDPTGPQASGRYLLISVNGQPLPALMYQEVGWTREATGGYLEFDSDSRFHFLILLHDVEFGSETNFEDGVSGDWWQTGNLIQMRFPDGLVLGATLDDATVTLDRVPAGFLYVYRR
jgi:hypothetical protein